MITNEILNEKYRVQGKLAESCKTIQDYFKKTHDTAIAVAKEYDFELKYMDLPDSIEKTKLEASLKH
jgi:hypothetical protein